MEIEQYNLEELLGLFREQLAIIKNQQHLIEKILSGFEQYGSGYDWNDYDDEDLEDDFEDGDDYPPSPQTGFNRKGMHDAPDAFSGGAGVEPE